ncbi:hypothetical protein T492DRAFT_918750 [Pavlovales sp. CCMP2436]|nr:hypothetical protein T492DRAFT_918750 [Pavlovales sp. CCMP2436]
MAADAPMTAETKALLRDMAVRMLPFATEHLDAADLFDAAIVAIDEDIAALKNRLVINGLRTHKHMDSLQDKKWALVLERRELYRRFARTVERLGGDVPTPYEFASELAGGCSEVVERAAARGGGPHTETPLKATKATKTMLLPVAATAGLRQPRRSRGGAWGPGRTHSHPLV